MSLDEGKILRFQRDKVLYNALKKEDENLKDAGIRFLDELHRNLLDEYLKKLKKEAAAIKTQRLRMPYCICIATRYADTKKEYLDTLFQGDITIPTVAMRSYVIDPDMKEMHLLIGRSEGVQNASFSADKDIGIDLKKRIFSSGEATVYFHYLEASRLIVEVFDGEKCVIYEDVELKSQESRSGAHLLNTVKPQKIYPDIIEKEFYEAGIVGMDMVKEELAKFYRQLENDKVRGTDTASKKGYNFVLTGNPGTGKTTVARVIGKILHQMGLLRSEEMKETDRSGLVAEYIGGSARNTRILLDDVRSMGGTLFIDEAYELYKNSDRDYGEEVITTLLKDMEDHRGDYSVIIAGYKNKMEYMMENANPGFRSRFQYHINIPDYTNEELVAAGELMMEREQYYMSEGAKKALLRSIEKERLGDSFANIRTVRNILSRARERMDGRIAELRDRGADVKIEDYYILTDKDFGSEVAKKKTDDLQTYLAELDSLTGLESAKQSVHEMVNSVRINKLRMQRGISDTADVGTMHLVFKGNAGTGKTTVARLMGKIYLALGVLKRDKFVEVSASDLIQPYVGQSATKTREYIKSALGGVLFIDEAYILGQRGDFNKEALNALITDVENYRKDMMVIVAGYGREMDEFLDANQGLRSRFANEVLFEDYSDEELLLIAKSCIASQKFILEEGNDALLMQLIRNKRENSKDFGNARGVRNITELLLKSVSNRIVLMMDEGKYISDDEIVTIRREDIESCL
ncbi:AAA family ATPase [Oribacterium sp. WCC10]|uniref:AAA family ATPase n=1 Tax=Oribacterium sp. WCC10 TaxID=1855343 RepID=UPI0008F30CC7|nr:AAA family ATPase [Oribacterium sp. WCC10]SFG14246.1 AAA+-type ATPase, SpoVK/Ycf46/Vps4 family [Oribacterium sp. WCC10]